MSASISLPRRDRKALLALYRTTADPQLRLRAHVLLLAPGGMPHDLQRPGVAGHRVGRGKDQE